MSRNYSAMTTLVRNKLNQSATTVFTVADIDYAIEEALKEYEHYVPRYIPVVLAIESRYGTSGSTSANNLIDTSKGQFLTTDSGNRKVVENRTDHTWAVISSVASTAQVGLTGDIFVSGDEYRIYNRECWNNKQLYIGDVPEYYKVDSVEYPIGNRRNWVIQGNVLEIDVETVKDSNAGSTVTQLPNVDVLVRFRKPHILSELTDLSATFAATAAAAATSISATALQGAGTIDAGSEFSIQYHRSVYTVAASATIASSAVTLSIYPPLERAIASTAWTITFRETTLAPRDEALFADLAAARASINKAPKYFNVTTVARDAAAQYLDWGESRLGEVLSQLQRLLPPKTKGRYPSG